MSQRRLLPPILRNHPITAFPSSFNIGTDICHIPRILRLLTNPPRKQEGRDGGEGGGGGGGGKKKTGQQSATTTTTTSSSELPQWRFVKRVLREEEIEQVVERFEPAFRRFEDLNGRWKSVQEVRAWVVRGKKRDGGGRKELLERKGVKGGGAGGGWEGLLRALKAAAADAKSVNGNENGKGNGSLSVRNNGTKKQEGGQLQSQLQQGEGEVKVLKALEELMRWKGRWKVQSMKTPWRTMAKAVAGGKTIDDAVAEGIELLRTLKNGLNRPRRANYVEEVPEEEESGAEGLDARDEAQALEVQKEEGILEPISQEQDRINSTANVVVDGQKGHASAAAVAPSQAESAAAAVVSDESLESSFTAEGFDARDEAQALEVQREEGILEPVEKEQQQQQQQQDDIDTNTTTTTTTPDALEGLDKAASSSSYSSFLLATKAYRGELWGIEDPLKWKGGLHDDVNSFLDVEDSVKGLLDDAELGLRGAAVFLAGRFAAKEAIMKAHPSRRITYHDILILKQPPNQHGSRPPLAFVLLNNNDTSSGVVVGGEEEEGDSQNVAEPSAREVKVSISHDGEYATATALASTPAADESGDLDGDGDGEDKDEVKYWGTVTRKVKTEKGGVEREVWEEEQRMKGKMGGGGGEGERQDSFGSGSGSSTVEDGRPRFLW